MSRSPKNPQTVLQGLAWVSTLNLSSRFLLLVRQLVLAAAFGLSAGLDAHFAALALVAVAVQTFVDLFDAVGIPALVEARQAAGGGRPTGLARAMIRSALAWGGALTLAMLASIPLAGWLLPGFDLATLSLVRRQLVLLAPYAILLLPLHALGALFRSERRFHVFAVAELLSAAVGLGWLWAYRDSISSAAVSLSVGAVVGAAALALAWRRSLEPYAGADAPSRLPDTVRRGVRKMLPVYAVVPLLLLVDRAFASTLAPGSVAAIAVAQMLVTAIPAILAFDTVSITSFSESTDRNALLTRAAEGCLLVGVPVAFVLIREAEPIVRLLFGRGAFTEADVTATAAALRWFAMGLPVYLFWPLLVRTLQVGQAYGRVLRLALLAVVLNAGLDALGVFGLGWGVRAIAGATSACYWLILPFGVVGLSRSRVTLAWGSIAGAGWAAAIGSAAAIVPVLWMAAAGAPTVLRIGGALAVYGLVVGCLPFAAVRALRAALSHSFPRLLGGRSDG